MSTALAIPEKWKAEVEYYEQQKYNVLVPREIGAVAPFHSPVMAIVTVNPDPDNGGDIYKLPRGKFGLSKVTLDRIAQAGSASWIPDLCGRTDDGKDPYICSYKMVGKVKDLSGQWRTIIGEKEIDLRAIEAELRGQGKNDADVTKEMIQYSKHKLARAQSGAMTRAIRSAFALRSSYSMQELQKPFVIPKMVFTPDYSDPETKRFLLAEATGNLRELYGAQAKPTGQMPPALPPAPEEDESAPETWDRMADPSEQAKALGAAADPDPDEVAFREAVEAEKTAFTPEKETAAIQLQLNALARLMARKGWEKPLKKPVSQFTPKQREDFLTVLLSMPERNAAKVAQPDAVQEGLPWDTK
jgi:hypothetical protein